ncbi:MAG TPA: acetate kinase [Gammaproteobacteria bacterium]|nr:acetate kinase [Gammaproteobacteria bacterium]
MSGLLVINSGSSSIKYHLFDATTFETLALGTVERIGEAQGVFHSRTLHDGNATEIRRRVSITDHRSGLSLVAGYLVDSGLLEAFTGLSAIGHRVVHGGERFRDAVLVDEAVLEGIRDMIPLAPLHNPANVQGIEIARELAPGVPQVAVFDTAFHHTMPGHASRYALPESCHSRYGVRRYGFHGTSHAWVSREAATLLGRPLDALNLITLHLGNGASAAAIEGGCCVDTSMGMTPLEGLVMGTRCGDLDPSIPLYLEREAGMDREAVDALLNRESGLKGICGSNDMREVLRRADGGDEAACLALDMYCYRIRKYIGAYYAVLGRVDAVVFTGGVGENAARVRQQCCRGLESLGMLLDEERNRAGRAAFTFHRNDSPVGLLVIPTNEEQEIARQTMACIDSD